MFHATHEALSFQQKYPIFFYEESALENIISTVKDKGIRYIDGLEASAEDFYEAAQLFTSVTKAVLLQKAFVSGYFYANFEIAENIFKEQDDFHNIYSKIEAATKYDIFIFQATKFLRTAEESTFSIKMKSSLSEAHFKLCILYDMQKNTIKSMHHLSEAVKAGHPMAENLLNNLQKEQQTLAA